MNSKNTIQLFSPAKVNLFLAITGVRPDGFHDLVSLVAPITFGDNLTIEFNKDKDSLTCNNPTIPTDGNNLVLKALKVFRAIHSFDQKIKFTLDKKIPVGAGLGGGSSNGTMALRGLNQLLGTPLSYDQTLKLATQLGSDCPLFLHNEPVIMRGRGEKITTLNQKNKSSLKEVDLLIFKPEFSINTKWAYDALREGQYYTETVVAEDKLKKFIKSSAEGEIKGFNSFEAPIYKKYLALPTLVKELQETLSIQTLLSGSGGACVCFLNNNKGNAIKLIKDCLGDSVFIQSAKLL